MSSRTASSGIAGRLLGSALAVRDLDAAVAAYEQLGFVLSDRSCRTEWGIDVATFGFSDGSYVELVTPMGRDHQIASAMTSFLDQRGDGTYLTCIEVDDLDAGYEYLNAQGIRSLGPPQPAPPSTGEQAQMLWLMPRSFGGAFIQLLELGDGSRRYEHVTPGRRLIGKRLVVDREDDLRVGLGHLGAAPGGADEGRARLTFADGTFVEVSEVELDFGIVVGPDEAQPLDQNHPGEAPA